MTARVEFSICTLLTYTSSHHCTDQCSTYYGCLTFGAGAENLSSAETVPNLEFPLANENSAAE